MPELVDNGRTGFLIDSVAEAVLAANRAATLDRSVRRRRWPVSVVTEWSICTWRRMADLQRRAISGTVR